MEFGREKRWCSGTHPIQGRFIQSCERVYKRRAKCLEVVFTVEVESLPCVERFASIASSSRSGCVWAEADMFRPHGPCREPLATRIRREWVVDIPGSAQMGTARTTRTTRAVADSAPDGTRSTRRARTGARTGRIRTRQSEHFPPTMLARPRHPRG